MISIVVPIYNREKELFQCLESISKQNNPDFEVIMVDDGSTDNSANICKKYELKDKRFVYVHQQNSGVGAARNIGIEMARGDYITFIDSDDFILPNHLDCDLGAGYNLCVRGVLNCEIINDNIPSLKSFEIEHNYKIINGKTNIINYYFLDLPEMNNVYYFVTNKFFSLKTVKAYNVRFREDVNVGEDLIFLCDFFKNVQSIRFESERTYIHCYYLKGNSLTQKRRNAKENYYYVIQIYKALNSLYHDSKSPILHKFQYNYLFTRLYRKVAKPFIMNILNKK